VKTPINVNLEALRGYAAIFVVIGHLTLTGQYTPMPLVVFSPSPHLFLLVFFVLSGYVITVSNKGMSSYSQIISYAKKRLLRIYPIYFVALLFTLIVAGFNYSPKTIFWNFAMMQDLIVAPFAENGPTWSLHFEMLFYLLFIPLIYFRLNFIAVVVVSMLIAVGNYCFQLQLYPAIISLYLLGFTFWMGGACIAKYLAPGDLKINYSKLLSALFFILAAEQMIIRSGLPTLIDSAGYLLFKQHLHETPLGVGGMLIVLGYQDLALLPYCLYTVLVFSGRKFKYDSWCFILLLLPLLYSIYIALTEQGREHPLAFAGPVIYLVLSLICRFINWPVIEGLGRFMVRVGAWLGSISYGIYIIHKPLLYVVARIAIGGNVLLGYFVKLSLLFALIIAMAYLLEKVFQPRIKNLFAKKL